MTPVQRQCATAARVWGLIQHSWVPENETNRRWFCANGPIYFKFSLTFETVEATGTPQNTYLFEILLNTIY